MEEDQNYQYVEEVLRAGAFAEATEKWKMFHSSPENIDKLPEFLLNNKPSEVKRSDGTEWICVLSPDYEYKVDLAPHIDGLEDAWETIEESGERITYDTIFKLAKQYNSLSGKWLVYKPIGIKVDLAWANIARAVASGQCGISDKVSPVNDVSSKNEDSHVICIYNKNFTDEEAVYKLDGDLRRAGIKCRMAYKPDVFTYLDIYKDNEWGLKPTIYSSQYDLVKKKSDIIATFRNDPSKQYNSNQQSASWR